MEAVGCGVAGGGEGGGEDYEHWPDDATQLSAPSAAVSGYDSHNGLREWQYHPANEVKAVAPVPEQPKVQPVQPVQPIPYAYQPPAPAQAAPQVQYVTCYPPTQQYTYGYPIQNGGVPQMAYPAPAYYGYPMGGANQGGAMPYCPPGFNPVYAPAPAAAAEEKPKKPEPRKWQGRTVAEVEEDNMKIAAREGAYAARKVQPVGLKEDQMVWVVEVDGSHTLR